MMNVLMLQTRIGTAGALLTAGTTQTVADSLGAYLVQNGWASRLPPLDDLNAPLKLQEVAALRAMTAKDGNRAVILGDSLVENGLTTTATTSIYTARAIGPIAAAILRQRLDIVAHKGVSGERTDQFLARFDTDVAPWSPLWVIVIGVSNDIPTSRTSADILGSLDGIYAKCRAIGAAMVYLDTSGGGYGSEAEHTKWYEVQAGCRARHRAGAGFFFSPMWLGAVDHSTQNNSAYAAVRSGLIYDTRHPSALGVHTVYAPSLARFFDSFLPAALLASGTRSSSTVGDLKSLILNGGFAATGGTPGTGNTGTAIATLWTGARTGSISAAWSQEQRTDGGAGQWQVATVTSSAAAADVVTLASPTSSFASLASSLVGQKVRFEVDVSASASVGTIGQAEFQVQILNSSGVVVFTAAANQIVGTEYLGITSLVGRLRTPDFVLPAASDRVTVTIKMGTSSGGSAIFKWGGVSGEVVV